ncbi:DUF3826 domain-containing protein [Larkinella rosea]|uniref:DUF3826 domain-containing protein n=1 Tax=Larkinella rosea TaxID=2025312 RepID=A0A3P1BMR5_9BACT|nr:DUF3826 domain-containing protein [Larkinella rosea]RRB02430.1 DUF3826 domain-containing protein [Larkinella rosea]
MKKTLKYGFLAVTLTMAIPVFSQTQPAQSTASATESKAKADAEQEKKAAEWVASLDLNNPEKENRLTEVVATHLKAVRDWHNEHPASTVPAGINPVTGKPLTELDRQLIADSAMPQTVHQALMSGLQRDLEKKQIDAILDKYTIGKVAFTMNGYRAIVPNITEKEEATLLGFMEQAREQAVDYKSMKEISAIFEIYKTKSEQYLNANGRNWREMYNNYTAVIKAQKAAQKKEGNH